MSLSAYLAKNYLTASASATSDFGTRPKKRRKKDSSTPANGLIIADDDLLLSNNGSGLLKDEDEDTPMFESEARSTEFRKSKKNNWKTVGVAAPTDSEQVEADKILAAAAKAQGQARAGIEAEDAPAIVDEDGTANSKTETRMASGVRAGLQTAADTEAMVMEAERRRNAELKASKQDKKKNRAEEGEETVYRDATGRRIDVSMKRAEARAAELEKLKQEKEEKEDAMGEVQKRQKEEQKKELEEAKFLGVARHADDEEMNDELKEVIRWDDPMAAYMAQKQADESFNKGGSASRTKGDSGRVVKRKVYQGAAPPNRYGIKPGWRWDGVDRGNGFEKEWFQARGRKSRNENLEYQWQMDE